MNRLEKIVEVQFICDRVKRLLVAPAADGIKVETRDEALACLDRITVNLEKEIGLDGPLNLILYCDVIALELLAIQISLELQENVR